MPEEQTQEKPETRERGTFAEVECEDCGNEQVIFARPSNPITCEVCGSELAQPRGGLADLTGSTFIDYLD
ncbi:30S ribosomal protein S27e [Thermoplasmatales archaeon SW_10_69_26]|jgi:small subunit ribosomal protein S27e|nr:MAG: 30S ribosomal protein S27e [Thermoplasmatales archaeon SW_10_69_26]